MTFSKQANFEPALLFVRLLWNFAPTSTGLTGIWTYSNFHCGLPNFFWTHPETPKISPFGNLWTWKTSPWQQGILLQASEINMVGKTLYHWVPFGKFKRNLVFTIDMALIRSWKNSKNFWFDHFSKSSVF